MHHVLRTEQQPASDYWAEETSYCKLPKVFRIQQSCNAIQVDAGGKIHLIDDLEEFEKTVGRGTWNAVNKFADELREKKIKIGFFSSTPQGGGVALVSPGFKLFIDKDS